MIAIVDYGMGNVGSIRNMLLKIGADSVITSNRDVISAAEKLILPGVGAFDAAMERLEALGLVSTLNRRVMDDRVPVLGICLGMQLLARGSEEGHRPGLGWIDAQTVLFRLADASLRLPHMGWNSVRTCGNCDLFAGLEGDARFYFVHSYHVKCADNSQVAATTTYGVEFHSAVHRGNVFGTQFHPEKSHRFGLRLLKNFTEIA